MGRVLYRLAEAQLPTSTLGIPGKSNYPHCSQCVGVADRPLRKHSSLTCHAILLEHFLPRPSRDAKSVGGQHGTGTAETLGDWDRVCQRQNWGEPHGMLPTTNRRTDQNISTLITQIKEVNVLCYSEALVGVLLRLSKSFSSVRHDHRQRLCVLGGLCNHAGSLSSFLRNLLRASRWTLS
jgi:hypothetical protein